MAFRQTKSPPGLKLADVKEFGKALNDQSRKWGDLGRFFDADDKVIVTRVPARIDVMGGIADYSGSLVCEGTLAVAAVLGIQKRSDRQIVIHSANAASQGVKPDVSLDIDALCKGNSPQSYREVKSLFEADPATGWAAYVAGAFSVLVKEGVVQAFPAGANIVLASDIPWGSGISSSAAIEVAAMYAIDLTFGLTLDPIQIAALSQKVENYVVGAPCGIMDQIITCTGEKGYFLAIRCQPDKIERPVKMPDTWEVVGINSNVKHCVGGSAYTDVRVATFMGHRIILDLMAKDGAPAEEQEAVKAYLCNLPAKQFKKLYEGQIPTQMRGDAFLEAYGDTHDPVTDVNPEETYRVRSRVGHPVYENDRVESFLACMERAETDESADEAHLLEAGRLMYGSHWSYRTRCGLDCTETNFIVRMTRNIGIAGGLYGAKITGGGSGGTVAVLGAKGKMDEGIDKVVDLYRTRMGIEPDVFRGSSPGAVDFGHLEYTPTRSRRS